jgi:hypothetical protein
LPELDGDLAVAEDALSTLNEAWDAAVDDLGPPWRLTAAQRDRLTPAVEAALAGGWAPDRLAAFTGASSAGVRNPYAALSARLSPDQLPAAPGSPSWRPPWCGQCDPASRFQLDEFGYPSAVPCPKCRPLSGDRKRSTRAHPGLPVDGRSISGRTV